MKIATGTRSNPPRTKKANAQKIAVPPKKPKGARPAQTKVTKMGRGTRASVAAPEPESESEDDLPSDSDSEDAESDDDSDQFENSSDTEDDDDFDGDEYSAEPKDAKPLKVEEKKVLQAVNALRKIAQASDAKRKVLFDETKPIIMQIECIKIPKCVTRKLRFQVPHKLVTDASEVCLFVADLKKGKRVDHEPTVEHYEDLLRKKGVKNIKTIMPVRQLRVEYDQLEMKRRLMTQFDFFLADAKISGLLAHKLGMTFFRKNKLPTPVKMDAEDLKAEIDRALHKTVMRLHGIGNTFAVHVANGTHEDAEALENIKAVLLQLAQQFPGGWENIRSVHLKNPLSVALPIYITLKNSNSVTQPEIQPLIRNPDGVEGELSTILGASVKVFPDGKISVIRDKLSDESESENEGPAEKKSKVDKTQNESSKVVPEVVSKPSKKNKKKINADEVLKESIEAVSDVVNKPSKKNKKKLKTDEVLKKQKKTKEVDNKENSTNEKNAAVPHKTKKTKKDKTASIAEATSNSVPTVEQKKKSKVVKQKVSQPTSLVQNGNKKNRKPKG